MVHANLNILKATVMIVHFMVLSVYFNNRSAKTRVQPSIVMSSILASIVGSSSLCKRQKDVNTAAKATKPGPKDKLKRKKSGLCKLRKSKRALKSTACSSRDPMPAAEHEAWRSRADNWDWAEELNT